MFVLFYTYCYFQYNVVFAQRNPELNSEDNPWFNQRPAMINPKPPMAQGGGRGDGFHSMNMDLNLLGTRLTETGKWDDFKRVVNEQKKKYEGKINKNWEQDAQNLAEWSRQLQKEIDMKQTKQQMPSTRLPGDPNPGMSPYWGGQNEAEVPKSPENVSSEDKVPKMMSSDQALNLALQRLSKFQLSQNNSTNQNLSMPTGPAVSRETAVLSPPIIEVENPFKSFPQLDDFQSPIRWVNFNSNETRDGLAKVTDPNTGQNLQYVINGSIYVPIIDSSLERLGLTTTAPIKTSTFAENKPYNAVRNVLDNIDMKTINDQDWLAIETALGGKLSDPKCQGSTCQARCNSFGCETTCNGDTCAAGCVGTSCDAFCKGQGCSAMCIGEHCKAKCDGLSCDARCRGNSCDATCRSFSCRITKNGAFTMGGGTWEQHYPQSNNDNMY